MEKATKTAEKNACPTCLRNCKCAPVDKEALLLQKILDQLQQITQELSSLKYSLPWVYQNPSLPPNMISPREPYQSPDGTADLWPWDSAQPYPLVRWSC